jgi:hypothetical protein
MLRERLIDEPTPLRVRHGLQSVVRAQLAIDMVKVITQSLR